MAEHPTFVRSFPAGAEFSLKSGGTHFRVWAPVATSIDVVFEGGRARVALQREPTGYYSGFVAGVEAGAKYKYQINGGEAHPDPASRFQPNGPHGFSEVIDRESFHWTDAAWRGIKLAGQVIYELHLGTFTQGGTWQAAAEKLAYLRETGITLIEVMPVSDFPGKFGWGYDGVHPYAPASIYGKPDDMRTFVDRAHGIGIAVILDVVYNHLGPDGNYFSHFSPYYFSEKHETDWGAAINFDGEHSLPVREFFVQNAAYWVDEFHLDGLRLDATQDIHDESRPHVIQQFTETARKAAGSRGIVMIGENEPQDTQLIRPIGEGGFGLDALWNDDYHHSAIVALTGKADAYYTDYRGSPQELLAATKHGYLYQGQPYRWQKKRRGTSTLGLPRASMISFIQNHDQVANSARGQRIDELTSPGLLKALTALTLLGPATPMLFQGQEFGASTPFLYFADHNKELSEKIREGRREFLEQWRGLKLPEMVPCFSDPSLPLTFERCRLDHSEVKTHNQTYRLHCDLLKLRREDPVISQQGAHGIDGSVLSTSCFVVRYFTPDFLQDRLLLVNLGVDLDFTPAPEPLLAPPAAKAWNKLWSSEDPEYGGCGTASLDGDGSWKIPGQSAVVLYPLEVRK